MLKHTKFLIGAFALITALFVSGVHNTVQASEAEVKMWGGFRDKVVAGGVMVAAQPVTYSAPANSNTYVILAHDPFHWHPFYIYHHRHHRPRWHRLPPPPPPRRDEFHRPLRPHNPGQRPPVMHRPGKPEPPIMHKPTSRPPRPNVHKPMPRPRPHVKPAPRPQHREEIYQTMPNRQHANHRPSGGRHGGGGHRGRR